MLAVIEHVADRGGLSLIRQLLAAGCHQHRLHEALGLPEVEEVAPLVGVAHHDDLLLLVERGVGERARGDVEARDLALLREIHHRLCHALQLGAGVVLLLPPRGGLCARFRSGHHAPVASACRR